MKECKHYDNWCEKEKRTCNNCYYERGYNMSDEEMKVIDLLKNIDKQKCIMLECPVVKNNIERQLKIIELNRIIRKQSKEIEELKQNIHLKEVYVLKTNDYIKGTNNVDELCNKKWEDKIKEKIEELKKYSKEHGYINMRSEINVLQSLLNEEE